MAAVADDFDEVHLPIVISWYLAALANSACTEKWAFELLSRSGAVPHIVTFAGAFDTPSLSEKCFEALVALAEDPVTSREIIEHGALEVFKQALKNDDPTIQAQVSLALFRMSSDFENRRAILERGLFDSLIDFLATEDLDEEVLGHALQAVGNIITDKQCAALFEERMGWKNVYPYLEDGDKQIQTYAYAIVAQISNVPTVHYHFDDDMLQQFIGTLNDLDEFDPVVPHLLTVFKNCCKIPLVSRNLAQQVPLLIDRLYSTQTEVSIKEIIADILARLAEDANTHSSVVEPDQLVRICKMLAPEYESTDGKPLQNTRMIRKCMLKVLDAICENRSIRAKLHEYGAVEHLVSILHETVTPKEEEKKEEAPTEEEQAHEPEVKAEADVEEGWRVEYQMIVIPALYKMIGDSKLQKMLIERSIGDLDKLITSEFPDILNTALLILATLAVDDACREEIAARPHFMQTMIQLISNKKVAIRRNTLHALNSLAMMPKIAVQLCSFGLLERLKKFAASSAMINLNLSAFATNALETLCASNIVAKYWVKDMIDFDDMLEDGFYSIDPRSDVYRSIDDLLNDVIHLRTEVLLLDQTRDENLKEAVESLSNSFMVKPEPVAESTPPPKGRKGAKKPPEPPKLEMTLVIPEWPHVATAIANFVIHRMGGPFESGRIPFEADVSRCKYRTHSDVVMLGQLQVGTIRHRALLFKYLSQPYGIQVSVKRNRDDLSCEVKVRKGDDTFLVSLSGSGELLTPTEAK